jgi:hypothetical protein
VGWGIQYHLKSRAWTARESDPDVIDSIGVTETVALAKERFSEVVIDYLKFWAGSTIGNSDEFRQWSDGIAQSVACDVRDLWQTHQWYAAWFERACRQKIDDDLVPLTKEWSRRAAKLDMQHIENPHLSLESLLGADGNMSVAGTLEEGKKSIEAARQFLSSLDAAHPLIPAAGGIAGQRDGGEGSRATESGRDLSVCDQSRAAVAADQTAIVTREPDVNAPEQAALTESPLASRRKACWCRSRSSGVQSLTQLTSLRKP